MRQVIQSVKSGDLKLVEIPTPVVGPTEVLVRTTHSVVSAGTERAVRNLAKASLLGKAKARPDLVRQVISRARADGIRSTMKAVRTRLDEDMPLGYSAAGVAVEVGEHVAGVRPGMRVATGGAGHAEFQVVAQWGRECMDGKKRQKGSAGDYVCRNPKDHSDAWIVKKKFFESTYSFK